MEYDKFLDPEHLKALLAMCPPPDLRRLSFSAASGTVIGTPTPFSFDLPVGRGMYYALEVVMGSNVFGDLSASIFTTTLDGRNIHENEPALYYSNFYEDKKTVVDIVGWGGSTFTGSFTPQAGAPIANFQVFFQFYWTQINGISPGQS